MIPQFTVGATDLMAVFLLMSGLAMLVAVMVSSLYIFSITMAGRSFVVDAVLTVILLVLG